MLSELQELFKGLLRIVALWGCLWVLLFAVPTTPLYIRGVVLLQPAFKGETLAARAVGRIQHDLLPAGATLIVTSPIESFSAEAALSAECAFFLTLPLLCWEIWRFVAPGLYPRERRALGLFFCGALVLGVCGVVFAYVLVIPRVLAGLYAFLPGGVEPLYNLRQMVSLVAGFSFAVGLLFLLPVGMVLLSALGLVKPSFWLTYARHAILLSLIFSAILIPDPSGVSMVLLSVPLSGLYFLGYAVSALWVRRPITKII